MVIEYAPRGPNDSLSCVALFDAAAVIDRPLVVGAWMTRVWALSLGEAPPRLTNDVDLAADARVAAGSEAADLLAKAGYQRDTHGYEFRYTRMTRSGLLIIDLLVDSAQPTEGALAVYGLQAASVRRGIRT